MLDESQHAKRYPIAVANALTFVKNNKAVCRILNMNPYVVTLKKGLNSKNIKQESYSVSSTGE